MQRAKLLYALVVVGILIGCPWYMYSQVQGYFQGILAELRMYGEHRMTQLAIPPHAILGTRARCGMLSVCTYKVTFTSTDAPETLDDHLQRSAGMQRVTWPSIRETSLYREGTLWDALRESDAVVTIADSTEYPVHLWQAMYVDAVDGTSLFVYVYSPIAGTSFLVNGTPFTGTIVVFSVSQGPGSA